MSTPSLLELRVGFDLGLYKREQVQSWVNQQVAESAQPSAQLLELTTLASRADEDISSLLGELDESRSLGEVVRMELTVLAALYRQQRLALRDTIMRMFMIAIEGEGLSADERASLHHLEDALSLAEAGTYGSIDEVRSDLEKFIAVFPALA